MRPALTVARAGRCAGRTADADAAGETAWLSEVLSVSERRQPRHRPAV